MSPVFWIAGVNQRAIGLADGGRVQGGWFDLAGSHDVEDSLAFGDKVVGDEPPMAAPPHRLGAHDGAGVDAAKFAQLDKPTRNAAVAV